MKIIEWFLQLDKCDSIEVVGQCQVYRVEVRQPLQLVVPPASPTAPTSWDRLQGLVHHGPREGAQGGTRVPHVAQRLLVCFVLPEDEREWKEYIGIMFP